METGYAVVVYVLIQVLIVPCGMETPLSTQCGKAHPLY